MLSSKFCKSRSIKIIKIHKINHKKPFKVRKHYLKMDSQTKARYIAIADLALERSHIWSKEFDKEKHGYLFYQYFIKKLNEEWKQDKVEITAKDYDYIINNSYDLYQGEAWSCFRGIRAYMGLPSQGL